MSDFPLLDYAASRAARDAGMGQVSANSGDFIGLALIEIAKMHGELTGEAIRVHLSSRGILPHNAHAWGALVNTAIRRGLLIQTGRYIPMRDVRSHARKTQILVVNRESQ